MSRINTNVQSLIAQRVLGQNNKSLNVALERLSTGLRINRGKDDPAGLIASENLKSEITSLNAAVSNADRADQVVNIAEGGLQEVSGLLEELQGLLVASGNTAGLSQAEKEANQDQIDSILGTIDRLASSTNFQGIKLLNGNFDYTTTNVATGVTDFSVNSAKFEGSTQDVDVVITTSAQQGKLFLSFAAANLDFAAGTSTFTLEITGSLGSRELSFTSGTSLTDLVASINTFSDVTGVTASVSGTGVNLYSTEYGSREFVSVKAGGDAASSGFGTGTGVYSVAAKNTNATTGSATTFANAANPIRDDGQNIDGTNNGIAAVGDGTTLSVNTDFLNVDITFSTTTTSTTLDALTLGGARAFTISGGGADFQLGSRVSIGDKVSLGIADIATRKLGTSALGFLDELGSGKAYNVVDGNDLSTAQKIVAKAIEQVSSTRGRLGAFQKNVVGATIRSLGVAVENTAAANSVIADADFASETASLTRNQILVSAAQNTLALANQQPQAALQLLG
ncbi:MAG TPA: flagellin [Phycisphaerales bacterium]|nr:flagellin [Phycisphaerales bacterium]